MYIYPLKDFVITQQFGENADYYHQFGQLGHNGLDLAASLKAPVHASRPGKVIFAGDGSKVYFVGGIAGNYVLLDHGDMWTGYAHNDSLKVKTGDVVQQGDVIALAGMSGQATGVHVHFEFIVPANPVTNGNGFWGRANPNDFNIIGDKMIVGNPVDGKQLWFAVHGFECTDSTADGMVGRDVEGLLKQWQSEEPWVKRDDHDKKFDEVEGDLKRTESELAAATAGTKPLGPGKYMVK